MSTSSPQADRAYTNVMERLVAEEVDRQKAKLPPKLRGYIKTVEVETFALNRLPALYASSEKGWQMQYEKAGKEHAETVYTAVRQGIAAVQIDPLRASLPLSVHQNDESELILSTFRNLLNQPDLAWDDILYKCKRILLPRNHPDRPQLKDDTQHKAYWQPSTYGSSESWESKRLLLGTSQSHTSKTKLNQENSEYQSNSWSDPRYQQ
ncbi:MAG: competence protein ComFB [Phormidesmis priestleyi]|uniref:Competence protein ComFB n=1 Tax=Phormidesmis priestleyi TaxID=268141 RepID=A0A2W4ZQB0_9CYAN|nr:MAG: competence protein ComFB [Phormidesmis priestleyi]